MKKMYFFLIVGCSISFLMISPVTNGQGIYQFWGSTVYGGTQNGGVLFSTKYDGTGLSVKKSFVQQNPGHPDFTNAPIVFNNKLYTVLYSGGVSSDGIIAVYDPALNTWQEKVQLKTIGANGCRGNLILYNNKMYGMCDGGINSKGVIFEYDPIGNTLTKLHDLAGGLSGEYPRGSLVLYNNRFYGIVFSGGAADNGCVFEFDPATNVYAKKADIGLDIGQYMESELVLYSGRLWGSSYYGGLNNEGTIFSFNPANNALEKKADFADINLHSPQNRLTVFNNKLYGATLGGGNGAGGIFEFNPATNVLLKKLDLSYATGQHNIQFLSYNNKLYTITTRGGINDKGIVGVYDPIANSFQEGNSLDNAGLERGCGALTLYNGKLYGFSPMGGLYDGGGMLAFEPANNALTVPVHLGGPQQIIPNGPMLLYNNKIYGTTSAGGTYGDGGIFEYNPYTQQYTEKLSRQFNPTLYTTISGGFTLYNNKFYGITTYGGLSNNGTLFEYDPVTNALVKKHDFNTLTGEQPYGNLTVFNGKLYGTCSQGSSGGYGNIFEYNPATGIYAEKVILDVNKGGFSRSRLTMFNNKLFGLCGNGGANQDGTLFEYDPVPNSFIKRADFDGSNGSRPYSGLTAWNGRLYGMTVQGGVKDSGVIFQYDPATLALTKRKDLDMTVGCYSLNTFTLLNNKLYSLMNQGGTENEGTLIEYNPLVNVLTKKVDFTYENGNSPGSNELIAAPAVTAPGLPNACMLSQTINISVTNTTEWISFTDSEGRAIAEINANGNNLGNTTVSVFVHDGATRQNAQAAFYLDRNITIRTATTPITPVSIRLYVRKAEFEKLKVTAGSGVVSPEDLTIFRNEDICLPLMSQPATISATSKSDWGGDYVYSADVTAFNSFYLYKDLGVVPVNLLAFNGRKEQLSNKIKWKASCTGNTLFTLERSNNGMDFIPVTTIMASMQDCKDEFTYADLAPLTGKNFYRLTMKEESGPSKYSTIILLDRSTVQDNIHISPNPVVSQEAHLYVTAQINELAQIRIMDMAGKIIFTTQAKISAGQQRISLPVSQLPAGTYIVTYGHRQGIRSLKMIKK
jgi:uncharacterized repeat protein (TIGR03803 family)